MAKNTSKENSFAPTILAAKTKVMEPHEVILSSNLQNAVGIQAWGKFAGDAGLQALVNDLDVQTKLVQDGDMQPIEGMLYRQAKTLETIFTSLARRAANNDGLKQFQVNLTLALKAQAQCRATLEALAEVKNPRPYQFVKQANINNGPQQVNNTYAGAPQAAGKTSPAENFTTEPNKLLETDHGNYLDTRAQGAASRVNKAVEAVGASHRAYVRRGEKEGG